MKVDVIVQATIGRTVADVAAYVADQSNAPRWYRRIASATWQTAPPIAIGSEIAFVAKFLGRTMNYTYAVSDYIPGVRLHMTTAQGPFPMTTEYEWHTTGDIATTMTLRNHGVPTGFSSVMAPLMKLAMRRAMSEDLTTLKTILETDQPV